MERTAWESCEELTAECDRKSRWTARNMGTDRFILDRQLDVAGPANRAIFDTTQTSGS